MISLEKVLDRWLIQKRISIEIDCTELQQIGSNESLYNCSAVKRFIQALPFQSPPALYWFSVLSNHTGESVLTAIQTVQVQTARKFPHLPDESVSTETLYVGQVKKDLRGRIITHLGYNSRLQNHGLQLCHWARQIGLKLSLDCVIMTPAAKDQTLLLESKLTNFLRPLIGKY